MNNPVIPKDVTVKTKPITDKLTKPKQFKSEFDVLIQIYKRLGYLIKLIEQKRK